MRIAALVLFASAALGAPLAGQASPAATVRAYFDAIAAENWMDAASLLRLEQLEAMRAQSLESFQVRVRSARRTASDYLRRDSTMPLAVAQYQADQFNRMVAQVPDVRALQMEYARVRDTVTLKALSLRELAARWLEAGDIRYQMRMLLDNAPHCPQGLYSAAAASTVPRAAILGEVVRSDTAWVLYRSELAMDPGPTLIPPSIATLLRDGSGWRMIPHQGNPAFMVGMSGCEGLAPPD